MSCAKTAEPIEMQFGILSRVGPGNHVLDGVQMPHGKGHFWGRKEANLVLDGVQMHLREGAILGSKRSRPRT